MVASSVLKEISLFAQDTWRVTPRLSLTYGARWELSTIGEIQPAGVFPGSVDRNVVGQTTSDLPAERTGNIAPRFGIAYRPGEAAKTVIRAGAGLYYDSSVSIATDLINQGTFNIAQFTSGIHGPFRVC